MSYVLESSKYGVLDELLEDLKKVNRERMKEKKSIYFDALMDLSGELFQFGGSLEIKLSSLIDQLDFITDDTLKDEQYLVGSVVLDDVLKALKTGTLIRALTEEDIEAHVNLLLRYGIEFYAKTPMRIGINTEKFDGLLVSGTYVLGEKTDTSKLPEPLSGLELEGLKIEFSDSSFSEMYKGLLDFAVSVQDHLEEKEVEFGVEQKNGYNEIRFFFGNGHWQEFTINVYYEDALMNSEGSLGAKWFREGMMEHGLLDIQNSKIVGIKSI